MLFAVYINHGARFYLMAIEWILNGCLMDIWWTLRIIDWTVMDIQWICNGSLVDIIGRGWMFIGIYWYLLVFNGV